MHSHCILRTNLNQEHAIRKRQIHKLERHGVTWGQYVSTAYTFKRTSEKEHETRSQSLHNNVSQNSENQEYTIFVRPVVHNRPTLYPRINQETLQQELLKVLEKHCQINKKAEMSQTLHSNNEGFSAIKYKPSLYIVPQFLNNGYINEFSSNSQAAITTEIDVKYVQTVNLSTDTKTAEQNKVFEPITQCIQFNSLKLSLLSLFTHKLTENDLSMLSPTEASIFQAVLERKNYSGSITSFTPSFVVSKTNIGVSSRRSEEKFKFIIKRIIKHLKKKEKIKTEHEFYRIYFSDLSEKLGVPLNHFYDPHNKLLKNMHFKSLSTDYVMLLLKSDLFLLELLYYLEKSIIKDHTDSLDVKVGNLCKKWEGIFESLQKKNKSTEFIKQLILNTEKGSKLPWSVGEVNEAIDLMKNIVYSWNSQKYSR